MTIAAQASHRSVFAALSFIDRYLTLWIILAMLLGIGLGAIGIHLPTVLVPIGLIVMMYPPFARVRYEALPAALRDTRLLGLSIIQNWVIAPILLFGLAAAFLHGRPDLFAGLVMVDLRGASRWSSFGANSHRPIASTRLRSSRSTPCSRSSATPRMPISL